MARYKAPSKACASLHSRHRILGFILVGTLLLGSLRRYQGTFFEDSRRFILTGHLNSTNSLEHLPQRRRNIAVASDFGFHFDVYMALVWTIQRVMGDQGKLQVYVPEPFHFNFGRIVDEYGLYNGTFKNRNLLMRDIIDGGAGEDGIDLVIFGTCEIDMRHWGDELLSAWDARDAAHKFQIVCIVHDVLDELWQAYIPGWSRRNAIRLLPISQHVGNIFHAIFEDAARTSDPILISAGLEYIPIDFHVPILDVPNLPDFSPDRIISNAVIQGVFDKDRRDYSKIFSELVESLRMNSEAWGYLPLRDGPTFIPDMKSSFPSFKLHLVGNGWLDIPPELKNLVVFHTNLDYTEYYEVMGGMDVCIPAFSSVKDKNFRFQASSSIAMCMEVNVPILAIHQLREAYTHIDDDRITITRPAVMSEVQALRALRTGDASEFLASDPASSGITLGSHPRVREAVEKMIRQGWVRTKDGFNACKQNTRKANEIVVTRILRDL